MFPYSNGYGANALTVNLIPPPTFPILPDIFSIKLSFSIIPDNVFVVNSVARLISWKSRCFDQIYFHDHFESANNCPDSIMDVPI